MAKSIVSKLLKFIAAFVLGTIVVTLSLAFFGSIALAMSCALMWLNKCHPGSLEWGWFIVMVGVIFAWILWFGYGIVDREFK